MTLESQIRRFTRTAKPGDAILLSKDGDLTLETGLILRCDSSHFFAEKRLRFTFFCKCAWDGKPKAMILECPVDKREFIDVHVILKEALIWSCMTGQKLACPDPEPEESSSLEAAYQQWWDYEASADRPRPDEDQEAHVKRMTRIAWLNGAYVQKYRGNGNGLDSHQ